VCFVTPWVVFWAITATMRGTNKKPLKVANFKIFLAFSGVINGALSTPCFGKCLIPYFFAQGSYE
jgi:hypothetical protein